MNPEIRRDDEVTPDAPGPYKFTPEELRALRECNRESFYQRCLPFGAILGFSTYYGVKSGYLRPSPRFGAVPKVSVAVVVGYFLGKFSYQQRCAEKLMALPNSQIGEMLRRRKTNTVQESLDPSFGPGMSLAPFSGIASSETYSDLETSFDVSPPKYELDDSLRPSLDNPVFQDEELPPVHQNTVTYEELRKKNRDEYLEKRKGGYPISNKPKSTDTEFLQKPREESTPLHRNKYGDVME